MKSYCLYCKTGSEKKLAYLIKKSVEDVLNEDIQIMYPVRIMNQKKQGKWKKVEQPLIPGYMFLYLEDDIPFPLFLIKNERNAYKILRNNDYTLALKGSDEDYARWVYNHQGTIRPSKVLFKEGKLVRVIDGPLCDLNGKIVKVDRHHKRVHVMFQFGGKERIINLSIEDIEMDSQ
ncbi:MAG: transcription termination/antitermination NusG family protein [Sphaerochaetaceae bacterium]|nr:transcription termination/antitermination NusG family protein [Sphaerochaetaceae bacterium]MDC7246762.1 transcription termination/antitermination NusG family protein [Sphaerochaetaceae bacterium]